MFIIKLKNQNLNFNKEKGIAILLAVLILSFVLTIALGTSVILIRQVKTIREIDSSVIAFYAADSGIEEFLLINDPQNPPSPGVLDGAGYEVFVHASTTPGCDGENYCIRSVGTYKNTTRAIEIQY